MSKLIKYLVVNPKNGKWNWNNEIEHHSIATPKMLNNLHLRIDYLFEKTCNFISDTIKSGDNSNSKLFKKKVDEFKNKLDEIKEELNLNIYMLNEFKRKVTGNLEGELSPIMKLKKMDSPLSKKKNISISHMYERYDNQEIMEKLEKAEEEMDNFINDIVLSIESYNSILQMYAEVDSRSLLGQMKNVKKILDMITHIEIYNSFFSFDDATRGLVSKKLTVKVVLHDAYNKLYDFVLRNMIKGVDTYRKSKESVLVEKAFSRMKELKIKDSDLNPLLEVKLLLDIDNSNSSNGFSGTYETCYKKVGEMHGNIHQKLLEISSLNYLPFSERTEKLVKETLHSLENIHKSFIIGHDDLNDVDQKKPLIQKNIKELEIYYKVISDLLLDCEPGQHFHLHNKLHTINNFLASKYYILNSQDLNKCLELLTSEEFIFFVNRCEKLMFALRDELKNKEIIIVDESDLNKIGVLTGKSTMINSYNKAIEVVLASLGTFMANTLHSLIREILQNLPDDCKYKLGLIKTYEKVELALREFDEETFSDSNDEE